MLSAKESLSTLARMYAAVRAQTERLAEPLTPEDQSVQSMPDASPTKWHLAHTTWFYETFLLAANVPGYTHFDPRFTFLFNSYYKQLEGHPIRANRGLMSRPNLDEVREYRRHVDARMSELLEKSPAPGVAALVELGLNHEQQHQELILTDIKHALWNNPLRPAYLPLRSEAVQAAPTLQWIAFEEGLYEIGHSSVGPPTSAVQSGGGFAFDNESPRHKVYLYPFRLASRLVTNGEYLAFMADGGYRRPELWLSDGWDVACANRWESPLYWFREQEQWLVFTLGGTRPVDLHEPVCHVSFYEADAYSRWAGKRLPTEAEWEIACVGRASRPAPAEGNLLESERYHPAAAEGGDGLRQLFGDVWEWTASPYVGYPGYKPPAGVLGEYNGKFMCNQMVLRGGSCATPQSHIRATYRNFFPPAARWQFMGIRLAQ